MVVEPDDFYMGENPHNDMPAFLRKVITTGRRASDGQDARPARWHSHRKARIACISGFGSLCPRPIAGKRQREKVQVERVLCDRAPNVFAKGCGPRQVFSRHETSLRCSVALCVAFPPQALKKLHSEELTDAEKAAWMNSARLDAILGSCMRSMPSVRSGIRAYICFVGTANALACVGDVASHALFCASDETCVGVKTYFPPKLEWLLAWSTMFRCEGTLGNYLGYVKTGCLMLDKPVQVTDIGSTRHPFYVCVRSMVAQVFDHVALRRCKAAAAKRQNFEKRPKKWIRRAAVEKLLEWCQENTDFARFGLLFLVAYVFLLRLPSEALPIQNGRGGEEAACLSREGDKLVLKLRRRQEPCMLVA